MRALAIVAVLAAAPAHASPAVRYNEPAAGTARSPLLERIEALVAEVAQKERREAPRPDARLAAAAQDLARKTAIDGRPDNDLVQAALWLNGIVEPPPHLILAAMPEGGDRELLEELRRQLPRAIGQGRYRRVGAALQRWGEESLVIVALQESGLELAAIPRSLPNGGPAPLQGRLHPPFERPEAFVTAPDGKVTRLPLTGDATRFAGTFRCGPERGRYQVELTGEDRFGSTVLANFPIFCGAGAPQQLVGVAAGGHADEPVGDAASAEGALVHLVNQDRAKAGLAPLVADGKLAEVARAHSADMQAHGFVGHLSPTTGSAADRLKRAHIDTQMTLENVARAYSPSEAERGLMESPGHRANVLNKDVTRIGVGVVIQDGVGGAKELLVTQLFIQPLDKLDGGSVAALRHKIEEARRGRRLPPFGLDPALDQVAQSTADELGRGTLRSDAAGAPLERALGKLADRYASVRSVVATAGGVSQVMGGLDQALSDPTATTCGIGLAAGQRADHSAAIFAVIVLATRR